jgi:hypothetical protein
MTKLIQHKKWWQKTENQRFFKAIKDQSTTSLLLKHQKNLEIRFIIEQHSLRHKVRKKLPQWVKNNQLIFPPLLHLEQSSSEAVAQFKATQFRGHSLTDLTGGFGVDCFYMGANFKNVSYNEPNEYLCQLVSYNFRQLNFNAKITGSWAQEVLKTLERQSVIYVDPSRRNAQKQKVISVTEYMPQVIDLQEELVAKANITLIKISPMVSLPQIISAFPYLQKVWVLSHKNECKEVLLELAESPADLSYHAVNLKINTKADVFIGIPVNAAFAYQEPLKYILEPNTSILKAGLVNTLSQKFKLAKLHANTQLLTCDDPPENFPGKVFLVREKLAPYTKSLNGQRLNVVVRNFPDKGPFIEKRLKLKPSKNGYLLAFKSQKKHYFATATLVT